MHSVAENCIVQKLRGKIVFQILLITLVTVPILEIYLLFQVGGIIGAGWTILIVIGTAVLGASLLRQQGLATWTRLNQRIAQGQLPPTILVEGIFCCFRGLFCLHRDFSLMLSAFFFLCRQYVSCLRPLYYVEECLWLRA